MRRRDAEPVRERFERRSRTSTRARGDTAKGVPRRRGICYPECFA